MDVDSLINAIERAYASELFYRDSGIALTSRSNGVTVSANFETDFERGGHFFFSVAVETSFGHKYAHRITADGKQVRLGDPEWRDPAPESLGAAIACVAGVSFGCAHVIPRLLLSEEVGGRGLFDWPERTLIGPDVVETHPCFLVEVGDRDYRERIYVHQQTLKVRRIVAPQKESSMTLDYFVEAVST